MKQDGERSLEMLKVSELIPYERNARTHSAEQVDKICRSIKEFGFINPVIIDKGNMIVAGHGRILAAKKMGLETVPCLRVDNLTDEQVRAYVLADNRLAEEAGWDDELLKVELAELQSLDFDITLTGFDMPEVEEPKEVVEDDFEIELPVEPKTKRGDVYQLGNHRLMCGDSTAIDDVLKLLGNKEYVDLVVTDPPYNMAYEGAGNTKDRKSKKIMNDNMSSEDFERFMTDVYTNYYTVMRDGASLYVFYKELGEGVFITTMANAGLTFKQELIWVKNQIVLGGSKYQSMYEPFLMACKGSSIKKWNGNRNQRSVIESIDFMSEAELKETIKDLLDCFDPDILRERKQMINDLHPTMKPVRLIAKLIKNSSDKGDIVLDLFGGSGTTMIAAEQTERSAYLMELDPKYCDVIIERWETLTKRKAVLLNG